MVPTNVGNMYNKGVEIDLAGEIIRKEILPDAKYQC